MGRVREGARWMVAATVALAVLASAALAQDEDRRPRPVPGLDLERYVGLWYEIARLPNKFQKKCASDVVAHYSPTEDGRLEVVNSCSRDDGKRIAADGVARPAGKDRPASQLEVRFAPAFLSWLPWVWGDYWVLDVGPEYDYALVGTPDRSNLWILARTPELAPEPYERLVDVAREMGYDTERLIRTPQTPRQIPSEAYGLPEPPGDD